MAEIDPKVDSDSSGDPPDPVVKDPDQEDGFSEKQYQQLATLTGRIVANQIEEKIMPTLNNLQTLPETPAAPSPDASYQERIFAGDVEGVVTDIMAKGTRKATAAQQQVTIDTKKAIADLSERPFYKDTLTEIETETAKYVAAKYPPKAAAELGYQVAKANHLESQLEDRGQNLSMSTGGSGNRNRPVKVKLPKEFEAACERDIAKGVFKDRDEFIAKLSPEIRQRYGM